MDNPHFIDIQDQMALIFFVVFWAGYAWFSRSEHRHGQNLLTATNRYRLQWMREMLKRENRSVDAIMVGNLTRSFTFFASTTMFVLAALVSMLGYRERMNSIIEEIPFAKLSTPFLWQIKIFLLVIIFTYAFFKFTWSMRQYNYVSIFIGAAPDRNDRQDEHETLADIGASLTGNAARHFNDGLRSYYFGLAVLAWFIHPYAFIAATTLVIYVTHRREYRSRTLTYLLK